MTDRVCGTCGAQPCRCSIANRGSQGWIPPYSVQMYGGAPDPAAWPPPRVEPLPPPPSTVGAGSLRLAAAEPTKVTVAAHIAADGTLKLRVSVDGVLVDEVETDGTTITLTAEIG